MTRHTALRRARIAVRVYPGERRWWSRWRLRGMPVRKVMGPLVVDRRAVARVTADPQAFIRFGESLAVQRESYERLMLGGWLGPEPDRIVADEVTPREAHRRADPWLDYP